MLSVPWNSRADFPLAMHRTKLAVLALVPCKVVAVGYIFVTSKPEVDTSGKRSLTPPDGITEDSIFSHPAVIKTYQSNWDSVGVSTIQFLTIEEYKIP